jgi:hypothetical protein
MNFKKNYIFVMLLLLNDKVFSYNENDQMPGEDDTSYARRKYEKDNNKKNQIKNDEEYARQQQLKEYLVIENNQLPGRNSSAVDWVKLYRQKLEKLYFLDSIDNARKYFLQNHFNDDMYTGETKEAKILRSISNISSSYKNTYLQLKNCDEETFKYNVCQKTNFTEEDLKYMKRALEKLNIKHKEIDHKNRVLNYIDILLALIQIKKSLCR